MKVRLIIFLFVALCLKGNFLFAQNSEQADTIITHWLNEAETHLAAKKFNKAIAAWDSGLAWADSMKSYTALSDIHFRKSAYFESKNLDKKALVEMKAALDVVPQSDWIDLELAVLDSLVQFSLRTKNFEDAYSYKQQWNELRDSWNDWLMEIQSSVQEEALDSLQIVTEDLDKELSLFRGGYYKQGARMEAYGAIAGGVLLLLLVILIVVVVRSRNRMKKRMSELSNLAQQIKASSEKMRKLQEISVQQDLAIAKLASNSTEIWELVPALNTRLKTGTGKLIADAHDQLEQLARVAGNALPVEKYLELQNTLSRASQELRDLGENLDTLHEGK